MKLIAWNCQGAFRKKAKYIADYKPDIAIISECEHPDRLHFENDTEPPTSYLWFGDNQVKGIGIFSYSGANFELYEGYDPSIRYCIPIRVFGRWNFNLIAIWAMNHADRRLSYIGQIYSAVEKYADFIKPDETVLLGDWNSNKQWDDFARHGNHSQVVAKLAAKGITSVYHAYFQEPFGEETIDTFYLYRKRGKGYHMDYCFVPETWLERLKVCSVGSFDDWSSFSDHSPIFAEFRE